MSIDDLRARFDDLMARYSGNTDRRAEASGLHGALVEFKVAVQQCRESLAAAERELAAERQHETDAERRGKLASDIGDAETAEIAGQFTTKHRERVGILERKVAVIRDELAYAEREYNALAARIQSLRQGAGPISGAAPAPDLGDREFDALRAKADRDARDQAVQQQLELLKKKLGKQ